MAFRPQAVLKVKITNYQAVYDLGIQVSAAMALAVANFPAPSPTLIIFNGHLADLATAISDWGPESNRGSHAQLVILRSAVAIVYTDLLLLAAYVQNLVDPNDTYPDQTTFILSSGFPVKNAPTPQGVLQAVEGFGQRISPSVSIYTPKFAWRKPLGLLSPNNVKSYEVLRGIYGAAPTPPEVIAIVTKTSFIDFTAQTNTQYQYYVRGVNTNGSGTLSTAAIVSIPV